MTTPIKICRLPAAQFRVKRRKILGSLVLAGLVAAACSSSDPGNLEFGVRRLALDLAFVDEDAAPPAQPEVIIQIVPAPPEVTQPDFDFDRIRVPADAPPPPPPLPPADLCPTAPPEATVELVASPGVIDPPTPGGYLRDNSGTIELLGAGLPLRLPYPFLSTWTVSDGTSVTRPGPLGAPTGTESTQFTITKSLGGGFDITEIYEIGAEALLLVERKSVANGVETVIRPEPPIEFFHFGAEGDDWASAGVDLENGFAMVIQGVIRDREVIDVCGDLIDTFVIDYTEQVVNLNTLENSGTNPDEPSVINIATQYGGLVVREEMHTTQRTTAPDGSNVVINLDYVSTLTSIGANL